VPGSALSCGGQRFKFGYNLSVMEAYVAQDRKEQPPADKSHQVIAKITAEPVGSPGPTSNDGREQTAALLDILAMGQKDLKAGKCNDADEFFKEFDSDPESQ
jgi:hypothetical protein